MNTGIPALDATYKIAFLVVIMVLLVMSIFCLLRAIIGPRITDRIVSINMIGTMVMVIIAIFSVSMEGYLADICLIYAMISFLAVVVLCKLYTGVYLTAKKREDDSNMEEEQRLQAQEIEQLVKVASEKLNIAEEQQEPSDEVNINKEGNQ